MPDVVLYREDKNWIYFVESVTSVGQMDPKRLVEIGQMTGSYSRNDFRHSIFLDFKTFKKFSREVGMGDRGLDSWEEPEHMIHLNGNKFLGPR